MAKPAVLLLHGLGENEMRMLPICMKLDRQGYSVTNLSYPSTVYPPEQLAEEFILPALKRLAGKQELHIVTHSMGGVLIRYCFQTWRPENLSRVVMLAPANHGSEILQVYRYNPFYAALYGPAGQQSGVDEDCFPCKLQDEVNYELGIIAGSLPLDPFSLPVMPWPHDGRTSVEGTKLEGMKDHIVIPASHELIPFHPLAVYQTEHFLAHGHFSSPITH